MSEPFNPPAAPPPASTPAPVAASPPSAPPIPSLAPAPVLSPPGGGFPNTLQSEPPAVQSAVNRVIGQLNTPPASPALGQPVAPPPPAAPPVDPVLRWFQERGIQVNDPALLDSAFTDIAQRARQAEAYRQQLARQTAPPPEPTPAPQAQQPPEDPWAKHWNVPQRDPQWDHLLTNGYVTKNERGLFVVTPEAAGYINPAVAEQMNRYEAARREAARSFLENPYQKTFEAVQPKFRDLVREELQQMQQQMQAQAEDHARRQQVALFEQQNAQWMYTKDTLGNDAFTPEGQFVADRANAYIGMGLRDPVAVLQLAQRDLHDAISASRPTPPPAPPAPPVQAAPPPPAPSFMQQALQNPKVQQALHNPSHVPQPPVVASVRNTTWSSGEDEMKRLGRQVLSQIPLQ